MSRTASVLLLCCLGLASLSPSTAQAETSPRSELERVGKNGLLRLKPGKAPSWGDHGLFTHAPLVSLKLNPPSARGAARSFSDMPDYASRFTPSRLKAARVTAWTLPEDETAAFELALSLGSLESSCGSRRAEGGAAAERAGCSVTTPTPTTGEALDVPDRASSGDLLADLGVNAGSVAPTLLRYSDEETNVSLLISPGGPCTGACLKLAGSF
jgi:hypothetical protein